MGLYMGHLGFLGGLKGGFDMPHMGFEIPKTKCTVPRGSIRNIPH